MHTDTHSRSPQFRRIFWDRPEIARMSLKELKTHIDSLRSADDSISQSEFHTILRRFIERGFLTEALELFQPEEIWNELQGKQFWKHISQWRINAWKNYLEYHKSTNQ